ncbi:hypothetical protein JEZ13_00105 [bacterium]|nr:hypothetical protein [bacterium]
MKYIYIILFILASLIINAQDILQEDREPIIVETKADLQSDLELLPIKYFRDVEPDSLQKFNYSYHGRPLKGDFFLFPERKLTAFFNLSSGSHDLIDFTNYFTYQDYTLNLNYLKRDDKGDRDANLFSMQNTYKLQNHQLGLKIQHLDSYKEIASLKTENKTQNISFHYSLDPSAFDYLKKASLTTQYETNSTFITKSEEYWNINAELEVQAINNISTYLSFSNNHKSANSQVQIYYQNIASFGLWSGISQDKIILAPFLNYYLNYENFTLKVTNKPYLKQDSFFDYYQKHLYGNYGQVKTDYLIPGNANLEVSYFNFLAWSLGSHYKYCLDAPIYRQGNSGEGLYYNSYWENSYYAKASYLSKSLSLSAKAELIDYNNFNNDFLPFKPKVKITNSATYNFNKITLNADYILESKAKDDWNNDLDKSHILNASANYMLNNKFSFWTELNNLLNNNKNAYFQDQINNFEFKAGIKLFF